VRVAIYARVSTEDQNISQQVKNLKQHAKKQGYNVIRVYQDMESGRLPLGKRKKFSLLLKNISQYDAVLVYNIDRLTRHWPDESILETYFSNGTKLISMSDPVDLSSASGRLMFRIKMAVSCYMPEDMREKQRIGIARAKAEGKYKGRQKGAKNKS